MSANYYIINLIDGLALVPSSWLTDDQKLCYWPKKYAKTRIDTAIRNREMPQISKDWSLFTVLKIYGTSDTFEQGLIKLKKCDYVSDLESGNTSTDDHDMELQNKTRHNRITHKDSSDSDDSSVGSMKIPQSKTKCNSKLSQTRHTTLSSFPEPPQSLTVIHEVDIALNPDTPSMRQQDGRQKPIVVATYESPIFCEQRLEKNHKNRASSEEITQSSTDYNDNVLQTESVQRGKQPCQQSTYNPRVELNQETEFKKEVLRKLNKLLLDVKIIQETIDIMKPDKNDFKTGHLEVTKDLPLATFGQLQQMENKLEDETFFRELVKILSGVGGHDLNNITTNILKRLLSNALAEEFSLLGKKNKKSFTVLKLMKVVIGAVRFHNKDATEITITQYIGRWLVQARQRHDRELEKLQKKDAVPINS